MFLRKAEIASAATICLIIAALAPPAGAQSLSIREIQFPEPNDPNGASPYAGAEVDCLGGICTAKYPGFRPRLILQDPNEPNGWGAIQVKDWNGGVYDYVNVGDWVALTNMVVEEFRGTTTLQWYASHDPGYEIGSVGNPLPPPLIVPVSAIPSPECTGSDPNDPNYGCWVASHDAEPYESMLLRVRDVTVTVRDLGKERDNYILSTNPDDPEAASCWAADYMNLDAAPYDYHPFVEVGQHFCAVSGLFEQYTRLDYNWDYYQLVTLSSADLGICGDTDHDGDVDLTDLAQLLGHYGAVSGAVFEDGDFDYDGDVDLFDLATLLGNYGTLVP